MGIFGLFNKKRNVAKSNVENKQEVNVETTTPLKATDVENVKPTNNVKEKAKTSETSPCNAEVKEAPTPVAEKVEVSTVQEKTAEYTGRFEINKSKDGKKFFFNLYASNKVGIATSQMYSTSQSALNGVKSVIANAPKAPIEDQSLKTYETLPYPKWEIYVDNGGKYRFRLSASNGNCVCHSQGYTTKNACKNGIDSIIRSSKNAEIDKTYINKKDEE